MTKRFTHLSILVCILLTLSCVKQPESFPIPATYQLSQIKITDGAYRTDALNVPIEISQDSFIHNLSLPANTIESWKGLVRDTLRMGERIFIKPGGSIKLEGINLDGTAQDLDIFYHRENDILKLSNEQGTLAPTLRFDENSTTLRTYFCQYQFSCNENGMLKPGEKYIVYIHEIMDLHQLLNYIQHEYKIKSGNYISVMLAEYIYQLED